MTSLSNLRSVWMVLNDLMGDLEKNGVSLSDLAYADLRNSKMVIEYLNSFEEEIRLGEGGDTQLKLEIEQKVLVLKDSLLIKAEDKVGVKYRKTWESKFEQALEGKLESITEETKTPISDIPRDRDTAYFRIRLPDDIPVEIVSELAEDCQVNVSLDGERHLQVSGKNECVRKAMKKLGELFYGESKLM
ncbi:MAG: DUF2096 domain-containing protein [Candidatus Thorarchaeota archaeon]|nr:MAG: DUF2096 domain-containing protein [Candidatus Thorarchaeota archaeon]